MKRQATWLFVTVVTCAAAGAASAAERFVGLVPSDGVGMFVKSFEVPAGTTIDGVEFASNDPATVFPEVTLVRGGLRALSEGDVVGSIMNVAAASSGLSISSWPSPVQVNVAGTYYVAIRVPAGPGKQRRGVGPAVGATDVSSPVGSFVAAGPDRSLSPLSLDLAVRLVTSGAAAKATSGEITTPQPGAFLTVRPHPSGSTIARIEFGLVQPSGVVIQINDASGRILRDLALGGMSVGRHTIEWDGRDRHGRSVASGIYFASLLTEDAPITRKFVLTR